MNELDLKDFKRAIVEAEKHLDMPASWVDILKLAHTSKKNYPMQGKRRNRRRSNNDNYFHFQPMKEDFHELKKSSITEKLYPNSIRHICTLTVWWREWSVTMITIARSLGKLERNICTEPIICISVKKRLRIIPFWKNSREDAKTV